MKNQKALIQKGINYDVGTNFSPGSRTREWRKDLMEQEIRVIRNQLHCNSIQIYGTDIDRLIECATTALENGLHVWLQPRLVEGNQEETLAHLSEVARTAEQMRKKYQKIDLSLGCELSIFSSGIMPGSNHAERASKLRTMWWLVPWYNKKLNDYLRKACAVVRSSFNGKISYGAALWEQVDWKEFDIIGLNLYKLAFNESKYVKNLRKFHRHNKPIVIFEFGCGSFEGADKKGPESHEIIDWSTPVPKIKGGIIRSERVQADYIKELLTIYKTENIYGAFVYDYIMPNKPFSPNPQYDLDMGSYGIVKVYPEDSEKPYSSGFWEPKEAFYEIAKFYRTN
ncbi:hypothetical protein [Paenibacillus lautus]|uniref:hypothetical protein n=1 Tax=Paenibacillus lautus TaxID=1401 RepID=UPI003D2AE3C9